MEKTKKNGFLQGAIILVFANFLVKAIGAIYKIPMYNMVGSEGMGYFSAAYNIYSFLFVISTAGLPVAVSRMVSSAVACGREAEARRIFRLSLFIFTLIGVAGTALMFFGAGGFTKLIKNSNALFSIMTLSPAILFVAIGSSYRGYYQGLNNMVPTAVSQVLESFGKMAVGLLLAGWMLKNGQRVFGFEEAQMPIYVAAAAVLGVTAGSAISTLYLVLRKALSNLNPKNRTPVTGEVRPPKQIAAEIFRISIPITLSASVLSITSLIDSILVMRRLQYIGMPELEADKLYGIYSGMTITLFNLPTAVIFPIAVSLVPVLAAAVASKAHEKVRQTTESALRITAALAMPAAAGMAVLSKQILTLLFPGQLNDVAVAAPLLSLICPAVLFVCLVSVSNAILQAQGFERKTVVSMLCGGAVKLLTNYLLIGTPAIGIHGAPFATILCYGTITCLNFYQMAKNTHFIPSVRRVFLRPLVAAAACGVSAALTATLTKNLFGNTLCLLCAVGVGAVMYGAVLLLVRGVTRTDLMMLPKGDALCRLLDKAHLLAE
ncbi:MAG: polysaccharide biosynthesis protein [Clostridia bacterium]|nr:polysaccharide biosynthesis protein [Clostridia bacterium]